MISFTKKEQIVILVVVIGILLVLGYNILIEDDIDIVTSGEETVDIDKIEEENNNLDVINKMETENKEENVEKSRIIYVDISGEVNYPGVYKLKDGSRVIDAVEKAGGLTEEADRNRINLAKKISDEDKIYIPKVGEETIDIKTHTSVEDNVSTNQNLVNINTATNERLKSLPGIGPVLAQRIIDYRNEKKFESIDELINVKGIGEKKFEDIKDLIIVK
ncbi:helix-hairpin-helix domain-containing protein [Caldisalinibacter kiritimatiensis]|uniref:Late competence protein ComEA, DNA receptor n=1 Tax=Caldisalinibacter kiritimatiensis TaxID=1304284 RepID=R1AT27_9FIRM|nr:helix-hairpin-helix domain-containing protein [Caldisalinibacter kiritimatiensis]EOC99801.1 Late competence protein ComEA, DNA receptor [Caldisalinibacter kiritimatiensis]